ncbi:MAG TPA: PAS-domain containing protein, partial [Azospira sp.]|nr:PAS-domain containing protein [Azospira sp.]
MTLRRETHLQATLIAVFVALTLSLGVASLYFSRSEEETVRERTYQELQAVADLKVQQIMAWRTDRLAQAKAWQQSLRLHEILLAGSHTRGGQEKIRRILAPLAEYQDSRGFILLASDGEILFDTAGPVSQTVLPASTRNLLQTAEYSGLPQFTDLHLDEQNHPFIDLVMLVSAPGDDRPLGFLVQRINPQKSLYPLIQSWPVPSHTAESLLVRGDGDQVLFLNQLRHQDNTALRLRHALSRQQLPAAAAVRGETGPLEGIDYRDKPVLATSAPVPATSWYLVAKVDKEEVFSPVRRRNFMAYGLSLALMLAGASFTLYLLRQQRQLFAEQQAREKNAAEELQRTQDRLLEAQRIGRIGSWERDFRTGRLWCSEEALRLLELPTDSEVTFRNFLDIVHPEDRERVVATTAAGQDLQEPFSVEYRVILQDGRVRHFINRGRVFCDGAGEPLRASGTTQDITERKLAEEEFRRQSAQLAAVLHNLPQGISVFDEQLHLQLWNEGMREVLELPPEILYRGVPFEALIRYPARRGEYGPGDPEQYVQERKALAMQFKAHRFERTRPNGRTHLIQGEPLYDEGKLAGFITTYTDISETKRHEAELERRNNVLQDILENLPDGVSLYDTQQRMVACNQRLRQLLDLPDSLFADGYPTLETMVRFNAERGEYGPGDREQQIVTVLQALSQPLHQAVLRERPNGVVLEIRRVGLPDGSSMVIYTDITARHRAEESLKLAEKVFANSPEAIMICDQANRIISVNQAFCDITGYPQEEVIGQDPRILASGRHDRDFYQQMWHALRDTGAWAGEIWDRRKNGEIYPKWMTINAVNDVQSGALTHYITLFSDITERKETEARIHHLAHHDPLTGLPNRFTLEARLEQSLVDAKRRHNKVAVMFLDLDRFKTINDSLGHAVGDSLLMEVALRLRNAVRESDTVARLGGDEFVVVLPDADGANDAAHVAGKIIEEVARELRVGPHELHTSASIGISLYPDDGESVPTVMQNADTAMYHAKAIGRNNFQFFAAAMN